MSNVFAQTDREALYPLLFTVSDLWKALLQRVYRHPEHFDVLVEAIRIFPEHYDETFEDIWMEEMVFRLLPVIKQQRMAERVLNAFDRRLPPVRGNEKNILRHFVVYDLKPTYAGLTDLTDSNLTLLAGEIQQIVLDSIMRNGIMPLENKDDIERHLRRLFSMASGESAFLLRLIRAIRESKSKLSQLNGKRFRVILSEILRQDIPNNREFSDVRQKITGLIDTLPRLSFWESIFGVY